MKPFSLRLRLLKIISLPIIIGLIFIGGAAYVSAKHEAEEIYDAQLAHFARVLGLLSQHEIEEGDVTEKIIQLHGGGFHAPYEKDFAYRVWLEDAVIMQSDNAIPFGPLTQTTGFTDRVIGKKLWRLFVLQEGAVTVEAAEDYHARRDLIEKVAASFILPFLLVIPLLMAAIWCGVRFGITPLDRLSTLIGSQKPEALQPLELKDIPTEIIPLVGALNSLMQQIEETLEREKRFTGYAAHELRTPLAALKTQVQVALRSKNPTEQQAMFAEVVPGIDRMAHLVEQLLTLVRVQKAEMDLQPVDLSTLARQLATEFEPLLTQKQQKLEQDIAQDIVVQGNHDLLTIALRNLLDNAMRYSPLGATIAISLNRRDSQIALCVSNSGVSLSQEQCQQIMEPFYRGAENDATGAGLGLAIVNWIARQHSATLRCESSKLGMRVCFQIIPFRCCFSKDNDIA